MSDRKLQFFISLGLCVATVLVFAQVLDHEFLLYDDDIVLVENTAIQNGLDREALVEADARVAELWTRSDAGEGDGAAPVGSPQPPLPSYESARPTGIVRYPEPMVADFLAASAEPPSPPEGDRSR